ncbi:unnamed protein product [Rhizophagus irregularis]|nr:unnamed protein product [Rhizophagus irregularis]
MAAPQLLIIAALQFIFKRLLGKWQFLDNSSWVLDSSWIILRDDSLIIVHGFRIVSGCLLAVLGQCFERFLDVTLW